MKEFIASYYHRVFTSVEKLARIGDAREVDILTREILSDLWERKEQLEADPGKGVFIYKVVLGHVFSHLKANGETGKMEHLQQILLIHPRLYQLTKVKNEDSLKTR